MLVIAQLLSSTMPCAGVLLFPCAIQAKESALLAYDAGCWLGLAILSDHLDVSLASKEVPAGWYGGIAPLADRAPA